MIKKLDRFNKIAWDFDGTLDGHPKSSLMHEYIIANPEKEHVIVTFRSGGWEKRIFLEMSKHYRNAQDQNISRM